MHKDNLPLIRILHKNLYANSHQLFQQWRKTNPSGFLFTVNGNKRLLHSSGCFSHFGPVDWFSDDATFANKKKILGRTIKDLTLFAKNEKFSFRECRDCRKKLNDNLPSILSLRDYTENLTDIFSIAIPIAGFQSIKNGLPIKSKVTLMRFDRDSKSVRRVKEINNHRCQICRHRIGLPYGPYYSHVHHIRPLKCKGVDDMENMVCVCPNCHIALDYMTIEICYDKLKIIEGHKVSRVYVEYHNKMVRQAMQIA